MKKIVLKLMFVVICVLAQIAAALPAVTSGTLHTHLSADYGTYYDWAATIAASDGQGVAVWLDQSGNAREASQFYEERRPVLITNAVNDKPVIRFDGIDDYTDLSFSSYPLGEHQPYTVFLVLAARDMTNEYIYDGLDAADRQAMSVGLSANPGKWWFWAGSNFQTSQVRQTLFQNHTLVIDDQNNLTHYIYGVQQGSGDIGMKYLNAGMRIGSAYNEAGNGDFDLAELIIYDGNLNSTDRQAVESYLLTKYAIDTDPQPVTSAGTLIAKFDGTDVTVDSDSNVVSWNDQIGAMDLLGVDVNKPSLTSAVFSTGTKNVVNFNGDASGLRSNPLASSITGPTTCFVVARRNSDERATYILDGLTATNRRAFLADGSPRTLGIYSQHKLASYTPDIGLWQVFTVIYNGLWSQIFVDGFNAGPEYGYIGNLPFEGLTVGSHGLNGANRLDGDIAEILVYEGAVDDANRVIVEQSLFTKYGIGPQCGGAYTTYNAKDFNKDCVVDFSDLAMFADQWLDYVTVPEILWKDSASFTYKWDMDCLPWDYGTIDLDNSGGRDWIQSKSSQFTLGDGIISAIEGGHLLANDTTYAEAFWPVQDINSATGYTTEFRVKIKTATGTYGAFKTQIGLYDSTRTEVLNIYADQVVWLVNGGTALVLDTGNNLDDAFHTFRLARKPGDPTKSYIWKDGVLIGDGLAITYQFSPRRYYIGDIDSSVTGTYDLDYIRVTAGCWAPAAFNAMDFDENYKVDFADLNALALEWSKCTTPADPQCD
jgi:hypothetical protein